MTEKTLDQQLDKARKKIDKLRAKNRTLRRTIQRRTKRGVDYGGIAVQLSPDGKQISIHFSHKNVIMVGDSFAPSTGTTLFFEVAAMPTVSKSLGLPDSGSQ